MAKVLKRTITPEIRAQRVRDTETVLDNYRENLRDHGVTDEAAIENFVAEERGKMVQEFERLDNGDTSHPYQTPNNWSEIADSMKSEAESNEESDEEEMSM